MAYYQRFTGIGPNYDLLCKACYQQPEQIEASLRPICQRCFQAIREANGWAGILGQPPIAERASDLSFTHEIVQLLEPLPVNIRDIQPVEALEQSVWVALLENGALARIDLENGSFAWLAQIPADSVSLKQEVSLHLSPVGNMAAVVNTYGQHGVVIHLETDRITMQLERDEGENDYCQFPVAFFEQESQLLLIHGTKWNRLDVSDPKTGRLLTVRPSLSFEQGKKPPAHDLDYFHSGLTVSPNQEWVVDNGWVWHPVGDMVAWNLRRWLQENVWESEDGPSRKTLCWRGYYWNGPLCWIDGQTLAVWGYGEDDDWLLPGVWMFDAVSGKEVRWFPGPLDEPHAGAWKPSYQDEEARYFWQGPAGFLTFDTYLFSASAARGTSVWDVATGERLLYDASLCPLRYHRGARQFLTILPDGAFQVSRLVGRA